jgi:hypothetical protein
LLTRLVAEFRAELAALGVRVTAVEEELARIRARLDDTRISGVFHYLYAGFVDQATELGLSRIQLTYTGTIAPGLTATLRVRYQTWGVPQLGRGVTGDPGGQAPGVPFPGAPLGTMPGTLFFDRSFLDWTTAFGVPGLRLRLGRDVIGLGPIGLLMDAVYFNDRREGLRADATLGPFTLMGFAQWSTLAQHTPAYLVGGRVSFAPIPGWTLGVNVRSDQNPWDPGTPGGTGTGFGADVVGDLVRGLRLRVEYATYTPTALPTRNFLYADLRLDLEALAGIAVLRPVLTVWYRSQDPQVFPAGSPRVDPVRPDFLGVPVFGAGATWRVDTFGGRLDLRGLAPGVDAWALIDTGTRQVLLPTPLAAVSFTSWELGISWALAPRTTLFLFYADNLTGVTRTSYWGTWLSTSW